MVYKYCGLWIHTDHFLSTFRMIGIKLKMTCQSDNQLEVQGIYLQVTYSILFIHDPTKSRRKMHLSWQFKINQVKIFSHCLLRKQSMFKCLISTVIWNTIKLHCLYLICSFSCLSIWVEASQKLFLCIHSLVSFVFRFQASIIYPKCTDSC